MRDDIKEYNAVENVAKKFCESVKSGKSEIVKPYFYEKAVFLDSWMKKHINPALLKNFIKPLILLVLAVMIISQELIF